MPLLLRSAAAGQVVRQHAHVARAPGVGILHRFQPDVARLPGLPGEEGEVLDRREERAPSRAFRRAPGRK